MDQIKPPSKPPKFTMNCIHNPENAAKKDTTLAQHTAQIPRYKLPNIAKTIAQANRRKESANKNRDLSITQPPLAFLLIHSIMNAPKKRKHKQKTAVMNNGNAITPHSTSLTP